MANQMKPTVGNGKAPAGVVEAKSYPENLFTLVSNVVREAHGLPKLVPKSPPLVADILEASSLHALSQFLMALDEGGWEEEHSSSALMGYLGAYVNIYNLLSAFSSGQQTHIGWIAQKTKSDTGKNSESLTGGDFGIAFPTERGEYRIAFFQAKKSSPLSGFVKFDITHLSESGYASEKDTAVYARELKEYRKKRERKEKVSLPKAYELSPLAIKENKALVKWAGGAEAGAKGKFHQLYKLACTEQRGRDLVGKPRQWVHYVLWPVKYVENPDAPVIPKSSVPLTVPLEHLRRKLKGALAATTFNKSGISKSVNPLVAFGDIVDDFPEAMFLYCDSLWKLLLAGAREEDAEGWLTLSAKEAGSLIGEHSEPGVEWILWDKDGGELVAQLRNHKMMVSKKFPHVDDITVVVRRAFPQGLPLDSKGLSL